MEAERKISAEAGAVLREGIGLVLSRWSALQLAVENEWGGRDSRRKAEQLVPDIFYWFNHSTEPLYIDDLEEMLNEAMHSLNTVTEDGSIEEVAEKLMIMHEECLDCNYKSIESLREANHRRVSVPHVRQVVNDDDDSDEDNDDRDDSMGNDDSSNMMVDTHESPSNLNTVDKSGNESKPNLAVEADGWVVVGPKRNRGKRN